MLGPTKRKGYSGCTTPLPPLRWPMAFWNKVTRLKSFLTAPRKKTPGSAPEVNGRESAHPRSLCPRFDSALGQLGDEISWSFCCWCVFSLPFLIFRSSPILTFSFLIRLRALPLDVKIQFNPKLYVFPHILKIWKVSFPKKLCWSVGEEVKQEKMTRLTFQALFLHYSLWRRANILKLNWSNKYRLTE